MGKILSAYLMPHPPLIIPQIGRGDQEEIKATVEAMEVLGKEIEEEEPETIIVITPHGPTFADGMALSVGDELVGDFGSFGQPTLAYSYDNDLDFADLLIDKAKDAGILIGEIDEFLARNYSVDHKLDHGSLIPLYFVDKYYRDYKLVHISYGFLSAKELYDFGKLLDQVVKDLDRKAIVIASGDLSHKLKADGPYGYVEEGPVFDQMIMDILDRAALEELVSFDMGLAERAAECGLRSLQVMAGALDTYDLEGEALSYEGPFGVGYGVAKINILGDRKGTSRLVLGQELAKEKLSNLRENENPFIALARQSLEYYIKNEVYMELPDNLPDEMLEEGAVFVTLKKDGKLRGCIGTIQPRLVNRGEEIIRNAVSAGLEDSRFPPVKKEELDSLIYSVDLLYPAEPIDSLDQLDVNKYGLIVKSGYRKGLLLPNINGVDTVDEQLSISLQKAGIASHEDYSMERFKVVRHE